MPGVSELLLILVIVLVIFGAGKLPQIGDALGRGIRNFKRATSGGDEIEVTPKREQVTASPQPSGRADEPDEKKA